jgi:Lon protease-like protein
MTTATLPLFPLRTVLFPGGPLELRLFEPRYLDMVRRCMREQSGFGVITILEGEEVGPVSRLAATGTRARVVDFDPLPGGLLGIACLGETRLRLLRHWQQEDGLYIGEVADLSADAPCLLPPELAHLADLLRSVLPKLGRGYERATARYEDAGWVANRCAEVLPLALEEQLALLELDEPLVRLREVGAWSERQATTAHV